MGEHSVASRIQPSMSSVAILFLKAPWGLRALSGRDIMARYLIFKLIAGKIQGKPGGIVNFSQS